MNSEYVIWKVGGGSNKKPKKYLYDVGHPMLRKMIFACDRCDKPMWEYEESGDDCLCPRCAFLEGAVDEGRFLEMEYGSYPWKKARAEIVDGEIYVAFDNDKFPWEVTNRDHRKSRQYTTWRRQVFERDGFKCQECGQVGGTLNAHHIKAFKDYPKLRFDINNGITLCEKCHKNLHKRLREEAKNGKNR